MPLFGSKHKNPQELVRSLKEGLTTLQETKDDKKTAKVSMSLIIIKNFI